MKLVVAFSISCLLFSNQIAEAKTPAQLKEEVRSILPNGKKARMVWSEKSKSVTSWTVYGYDSDEGQIRELTPASIFPNSKRSIPNAVLSQNGAYVVLKETLSSRVYVIDWNGQNLRQLVEYGNIGPTWQDPVTKSQYVMLSELEESGAWLVGLVDPKDRKKVWNTGLWDEEVGGTDGIGISVDGKRIGGFLCDSRSGIAPTPNGTSVCGSCGGCNFSMRPTAGVYEYSHFPNGHEEICVHNANGSIKGTLDNASTVVAWAKDNVQINEGEPVLLLWTNDPDYVSYLWGGWQVNPILFRISDKKWVAMRDDLVNASVNRFNVIFMPASGSSTKKMQYIPAPKSYPLTGALSGETFYTVTGQCLRQNRKQATHGKSSIIAVYQANHGKVRQIWLTD